MSEQPLTPREVEKVHRNSDADSKPSALHHSLGVKPNQSSPGPHTHDGKQSKRVPLSNVITSPPSVTGSRGGNAALASLLTQLATLGVIVNNTSA